ncbi:TIGR03943 family protein [Nocardioides sp. CFH 31398]|uniref:TIGR03943 family putative permease subunit n=1 Tax=Nocardioides sp. CFH 31398 TaxID=2919579 RepID=UPI001F060402|nr:TIGR03943 family protein [Nocardioides sp. CFH 31398]MCH1867877.1 TIGR03943 family protein [Nocardioides sp. CFH 31398]
MTRTTQALVLTLVGATLVRLTLTDAYLRYVNAWMRWPLLASGVLLVAVALVVVLRQPAAADADHPQHGGHEPHEPHEGGGGHEDDEHAGHVSRSAWLLLAPVLVVFTISPPALGAYSAERSANELPASAAEGAELPLPPSEGPLEIDVVDFVVRVQFDEARSLMGREVSVVGFVSGDDEGNWYVTRMDMNCCAADAAANRIMVTGAEAPERNSWVRVTGEWDPLDGGEPTSTMAASDVEAVEAPRNTYG